MEAMSDANEERLLSELLREVAQADTDTAAAAPRDLCQRTLSRWERSRSGDIARTSASSAERIALALALAAAVCLLIAGSIRFRSERPGAPPRTANVITTAPPQQQARDKPASVAEQPRIMSAKRSPRRRAAPANSVNVDFVPLVPMSADELSGSFQIVRVQMPRAALGALADRVAAGRADDPVQADLLLGEDGMARAIRVSANESVPWRSQ
jgi:hypothetical protein